MSQAECNSIRVLLGQKVEACWDVTGVSFLGLKMTAIDNEASEQACSRLQWADLDKLVVGTLVDPGSRFASSTGDLKDCVGLVVLVGVHRVAIGVQRKGHWLQASTKPQTISI